MIYVVITILIPVSYISYLYGKTKEQSRILKNFNAEISLRTKGSWFLKSKSEQDKLNYLKYLINFIK